MTKLYIPTVGYSPLDVKNSHKLFPILGGGTHGLMIITNGGMQNFIGQGRDIQYDNFTSLPGHKDIPVIVMAPNVPLGDIDFYHDPETSIANLKMVIDFTTGIPTLVSPKVVTFHLNSLLKPDEWDSAGSDAGEKYLKFNKIFYDKILPALAELASYAKRLGVELKVETTPVPEFGDIIDSELSLLGNPFPLYSGRGFAEIRRAGLGMALDLCHTFTLYKAARLLREKGDRVFDIYRGLFPTDVEYLNQHSLIDEVRALRDGDVVHLNDGTGLYDPDTGSVHKEGMVLGEGEIKELSDVIRSIKSRDLNLVFEVDESDFVNRSNFIKSVKYFYVS